MKILIASDKFKNSLSADQVVGALCSGIESIDPTYSISTQALADGGDGSLSFLNDHLLLNKINLKSKNPLGKNINTYYLSDGSKAYIELAITSGISLLNSNEYAPMEANTIGTGILIGDAIRKGHQEIFLALGGSASTDGGTGILHALGYKFIDANEKIIIPCGGELLNIKTIRPPNRKINIPITILSDVQNKMTGLDGAAHVYGPQKGATFAQILKLNKGLEHLASLLYHMTGVKVDNLKGGGAAGGVAGGLSAFFDIKVMQGFEFLSRISNLRSAVEEADIIITGEGRFDQSSINGKVVGGILELAKQLKKEVILVCGQYDPSFDFSAFAQISDTYQLIDYAQDENHAIENATELLVEIGKNIGSKF